MALDTHEMVRPGRAVPLSFAAFKDLSWRPPSADAAHLKRAYYIGAAEALKVASGLPFVITQSAGGIWGLRAVVDADARPDLVGSDGALRLRYRPFAVRLYPFTPVALHREVPGAPTEWRIGVFKDPDLVGSEGLPFFEPDGHLTPTVGKIRDAFGRFARDLAQAQVCAKDLFDAGVLKPIAGHKRRAYRVAVGALADLSEADVVALTKSGAMAVAHAQIVSEGHIRPIGSRGAPKIADAPAAGPETASDAFLDALMTDLDGAADAQDDAVRDALSPPGQAE